MKRVAILLIIVGILWGGYWLGFGATSAYRAVQPVEGYTQESITPLHWSAARGLLLIGMQQAIPGTLIAISGGILWLKIRRRERQKHL